MTAKNSPLLIQIGQGLSIAAGLPTIAAWSTPHRPLQPKLGTFGFNTETYSLEYWDGTQWLIAPMTPEI